PIHSVLSPTALLCPLDLHSFPTRRSSDLVGLEYALAHTCVFAKQSLDAILCGRVGLPLYGVTYYRHPLSLSYGVILPSSFSVNQDRKSTRLNSSHLGISYAVFCLKKQHNS